MSKEKPLHQKSAQGKITRGQFHSVEHLVGTVTVQSSEIQFQCHLQFVSFSHAATVPLARSSPPLPLVRSCTRVRGAFLASVARWLALAGVFCGVGTSRGGRQEAHHGRTPFRAAHRSLALRVASCTPAHARSTATVAGKHGTRSPPPTGPRHHRSVELALNTQTPASLTPKRTH